MIECVLDMHASRQLMDLIICIGYAVSYHLFVLLICLSVFSFVSFCLFVCNHVTVLHVHRIINIKIPPYLKTKFHSHRISHMPQLLNENADP